MRSRARGFEIKVIMNASCLATLIFITVLYLIKEIKYSRVVFIYFLFINIVVLSIFRLILRNILSWLRKKGYNLRYILIVGDGKLAQEVAEKITDHAEYGFKVIGLLAKDREAVGKNVKNFSVLGTYGDIKELLKKFNIDQLVIALPFEHIRLLKAVLSPIYDDTIEIKIVPDLYEYFTLRRGIEELDGLPIISLRESPLYGWNQVLKRTFDLVVSTIFLILISPFLFLIAWSIKLSSPGPLFYRQKRMGLDGDLFEIIKFRTMVSDAEKGTGPVWARKDDSRRTRVGSILRRFNLDELPQFVNVLLGHMSIVGPRPERPEFMKDFKARMPEYMLRHKMKAGITGWAQINGLRGDTSIEKRTEFDLFYIENWSMWLDVKICLKSFPLLPTATKNAY
jgi:Undecaprenyl-phosphate glucose phosphotransferase